ncbi:DNA repair exonuclease [Lederbergia sp. NSJ-179]|uniref:metallophosphoesterase family protein n=1 Tax=Lederbergia sp. NSJ-179 TaxID=2931402 RepID=UPI001FD5F01C|nr:DNA repair exonuclease [Lederbergia sp. NSJ-179]MCJ7840429.1 DNA repair exonuclease [Lederbergia sp. NSJ-179]
MKNEIHFIHTADLHLDSPFLGLKHLPGELFERIQNSTFLAFEKVIDEALNRNVDFIVIVGDLYDGEDRSIRAQAHLRQQMDRLNQAGIHAFLSHGNHDHLSGHWLNLDMPANVHIFHKEVEWIPFTTRKGQKVHLYGFSYPTRHVRVRKISEYKKEGEADFHIGLLHGHCESSRSKHQPYAPFSIKELLQTQMDYWALGHIHKAEVLHENPYIVYPGNPQGRHKNEEGEKMCCEVQINAAGQTKLTFIPTAVIRWESLAIPCVEGMNFTDLYLTCVNGMESMLAHKECGVLLEIILSNASTLSTEIKEKIDNGEFLEMIQAGLEMESPFIWPYKISKQKQKTNPKAIQDPTFLNVIDQSISDLLAGEELDESLSPLFSHVYASRYLTPFDEKTKKQLLIGAKELIGDRLVVKMGGKINET